MKTKNSIFQSRAYNIAFGMFVTAIVFFYASSIGLELRSLSAAVIGIGLAFALDMKYGRNAEVRSAAWLDRVVGAIAAALITNGSVMILHVVGA